MSRLTSRAAPLLLPLLLSLLLAPASGFVQAETKPPGALQATPSAPAPASGAGPAAPATGSHTPTPEPKPLPVATISTNAEAADASLRSLDDGLATPGAIATIAAELGPFAREFDTVARASRAALAGREQRGRIGDAEADLQALPGPAGRLGEDAHAPRPRNWKASWAGWRRCDGPGRRPTMLARSGDLPKGASDRATAAVLGSIDRVRKRVESVRENLFTLQDRVSRFQSRANDQRESLKQAMTLAVGGLAGPGLPAALGRCRAGCRRPAAAVAAGCSRRQTWPAATPTRRIMSAPTRRRMTLLPVIVLLFLVGLWMARWQLRLPYRR